MEETKNYKLDKNTGILECYLRAVKISALQELEKRRQRDEDLGLNNTDDDEPELEGEPKNIVINIKELGGIMYFHENEAIMESDIEVPGTFVEFKEGLTFILLIPYNEFKQLYYDFMDVKFK